MREYKLADTLRETMIKKKVKQKTLAREIGVTLPTLRAWLYGRYIKSYDLNNIAEYLGVSTDYLITGEINTDGIDIYNDELKKRVKCMKKYKYKDKYYVSLDDISKLF